MALAKYVEDIEEIAIENQLRRECTYLGTIKGCNLEERILPFLSYSPCDSNVTNPSNINPPITESNSEFTNKYLICKCCGQRFLFSSNAQKEYARCGWPDPKRCKPCRKVKRCLNQSRKAG